MKPWIVAGALLLPFVCPSPLQAQASRPAAKEEKATAELLAEAQAKLQTLETYEAWDLARTILNDDPKHPIASKIRDAARVLTPAIDSRVVAVKPTEVLISVGQDDRVEVGQVFTIYRGAQALALVRVTTVRRDSSQAEVIEGKGCQAGDSATSSSIGWAWFHDGKQRALPQAQNARVFRTAVSLAEQRRFYDLYEHAKQAAQDPCLQIFKDAALFAQRTVAGKVTQAGEELTLDVGQEDGLKRGDLVTFVRAGKVLGRAPLSGVAGESATCRAPSGVELQVGDEATTDPTLWPK